MLMKQKWAMVDHYETAKLDFFCLYVIKSTNTSVFNQDKKQIKFWAISQRQLQYMQYASLKPNFICSSTN